MFPGTLPKLSQGIQLSLVGAKKHSSVFLWTQILVKSSRGKIQEFGYDVMVFPLYRQPKKIHALCSIMSLNDYMTSMFLRRILGDFVEAT